MPTLTFPTPSDVQTDYLLILKTIRPEVDISKTDSDWWIRGAVVGGVVSGAYADSQLTSNDAFPQNARHVALGAHLQTYFGRDFNPASQANGNALVSGTVGSIIPAGTTFTYTPNGNTYLSTDAVTLTGPTALVPIQSVGTGQDQNLLSGAALTIQSPPSGVNAAATASGNIADGTDEESDEEAAQAILNRIQQPPAGGTSNDYATYAKDASTSVTGASVVRYIYGLGTVGIVITSGTTDIDTAIDNGDAIVKIPSQELINTVQEYIDAVEVLTDDVYVIAPGQDTQDVTVTVRFVSGDLNTIEPNTGLSQGALVQREVQRAIYKTPAGGRQLGGNGYVVHSEIEQVLDDGLSAEAYNTGTYAQILLDRAVAPLTPSGVNRLVDPRQVINPGSINVVEF